MLMMEIKQKPYWWSETNGQLINWHHPPSVDMPSYIGADWQSNTFEIPHTTQGTNYFNVIGNKYRRLSTTIKIILQVDEDYDGKYIRVFIFKNKGSVSLNNSTAKIYTTTPSPDNIFLITSIAAFPLPEFLTNYEVIYDKFWCQASSRTKIIEFEYKHEDVLDILSPHNLITVGLFSDSPNKFSYAIDTMTYFVG